MDPFNRLEPGAKKFMLILVVVVVILASAIGIFFVQRSEQQSNYERICNDSKAKIDQTIKDPKLNNTAKRTQINDVIAQASKRIPRYDYICEFVVPGL